MTQDMFSNLFSIYSLAIIPDPEVIELVRKLKNDLRQVLGRSYGSFNSPAHFTLFAFQAHDDDYPIITEEFKRVLVGLKPLRIEVSGFSHFLRGSNSTFYIKPGASSAQQIQTYSKYVDAKFSKSLKEKYTHKMINTAKGFPHMSIARELMEAEIPKCYAFFDNNFAASFYCDSFAIRKSNVYKGQYHIIDQILLLGNDYLVGEQIQLF